MGFQYGGTLLDMCVLALVEQQDTYGYKLTHEVKEILSVSESTLYPVLRRLKKEKYLSTYDKPYDGRNRRYYTITAQGRKKLESDRLEWKRYVEKVEGILERSHHD